MLCRKCGREMPLEAVFCPFCGRRLSDTTQRKNKRGNGQGHAYKRGKAWTVVVTLGYSAEGKRVTRSKGGFPTKTAALEYASHLRLTYSPVPENITFKAAYDAMIAQHARRVSQSTVSGYNYATEHFRALWYVPLKDIKTDQLQSCVDDCPAGKRTKQDMKESA